MEKAAPSILKDQKINTIHHCFLDRDTVIERGFDTSVVDFLDAASVEIGADQEIWSTKRSDIYVCRVAMLKEVKDRKGVAIFIGNLIEEVAEEIKFAHFLGVPIFIIP